LGAERALDRIQMQQRAAGVTDSSLGDRANLVGVERVVWLTGTSDRRPGTAVRARRSAARASVVASTRICLPGTGTGACSLEGRAHSSSRFASITARFSRFTPIRRFTGAESNTGSRRHPVLE